MKMLGPETPQNFEALKKLWPLGKFPVLDDDGAVVFEATSIIEHLALHYAGPVRLIPEDLRIALDVRIMDRVFDNYVMTPMTWIVHDGLRSPDARDAQTVVCGRSMLDMVYRWLDQRMFGRVWGAGETFSLADCAAAPSLFYADWAHPIADEFRELRAYRNPLMARPSFARAVDEARPHRQFFPLGAPVLISFSLRCSDSVPGARSAELVQWSRCGRDFPAAHPCGAPRHVPGPFSSDRASPRHSLARLWCSLPVGPECSLRGSATMTLQ
jgi:glutathione S-transferase